MIFLADSTGIIRLQTDEDLNDTKLAQYDADQQAAWFRDTSPSQLNLHEYGLSSQCL